MRMQAVRTERCLGCGGAARPVRRYRTESAAGRRLFAGAWLCECGGCGLVTAAPRPAAEALRGYYERQYRAEGRYGAGATDAKEFPYDNLFFYNRGQSIAELLATYVGAGGARILDIGSGFGHVLYALGERFPERQRIAIEISEACGRHLERLAIEVIARPVEEALEAIAGDLGLVTISHVLEHLSDPLDTLQRLGERLTPEGVLYVEVPNIPSGSLLTYPDHLWAPRHDEPHLTFFNAGALRALLKSAGFEVLFLESAGPEYRYISEFSYRMPQFRWLVDKWVPRRLLGVLRRSRLTSRVRMGTRQPGFYEYGGERIWLRAVARRAG